MNNTAFPRGFPGARSRLPLRRTTPSGTSTYSTPQEAPVCQCHPGTVHLTARDRLSKAEVRENLNIEKRDIVLSDL